MSASLSMRQLVVWVRDLMARFLRRLGCGLGGRMAGFGRASALMIGAGMVPRGEMALITAQIGFNEHVLGSEYYSTIIFIISLVTLVAPLLLKLTIRKVPGAGAAAAGTAVAEQ